MSCVPQEGPSVYHLSRECKSNVTCFTYGGRHHVSICESRPLKTVTKEQCAKPEQRENVNPEDQPKPDHSQVTMFISSTTPILLQTAQANIYKEKGAKVRIILDRWSQRSYITNRLKDELSLPVECQETMLIKRRETADLRSCLFWC